MCRCGEDHMKCRDCYGRGVKWYLTDLKEAGEVYLVSFCWRHNPHINDILHGHLKQISKKEAIAFQIIEL